MNATHEFTLVLEGVSDLTPSVMDALFEAGCDDATVCQQGGHLEMDFAREAPTRQDAITSAINDVSRSRIGARVAMVDDQERHTGSQGKAVDPYPDHRIRKTGA